MILAGQIIHRASLLQILFRAAVTLAVLYGVYYVFAVLVPRLTAKRCPECRTVLRRKETDTWRDEIVDGSSRPVARLVRYVCDSCGHEQEVWVRVVMARPVATDTPSAQAELDFHFRGNVPPGVQRWLDRVREERDRDDGRREGPDDRARD